MCVCVRVCVCVCVCACACVCVRACVCVCMHCSHAHGRCVIPDCARHGQPDVPSRTRRDSPRADPTPSVPVRNEGQAGSAAGHGNGHRPRRHRHGGGGRRTADGGRRSRTAVADGYTGGIGRVRGVYKGRCGMGTGYGCGFPCGTMAGMGDGERIGIKIPARPKGKWIKDSSTNQLARDAPATGRCGAGAQIGRAHV